MLPAIFEEQLLLHENREFCTIFDVNESIDKDSWKVNNFDDTQNKFKESLEYKLFKQN